MLVRSLPRRFENTLYMAWARREGQSSQQGWHLGDGVKFLLACWQQQLRVEVESAY